MDFKLPVQTNARLRQLAERAPFSDIGITVHSYPIAEPKPADGVDMDIHIEFEWSNGYIIEPKYIVRPTLISIHAGYRIHLLFHQKTKKFDAEWRLKVIGEIPMNPYGRLFVDAGMKLLNTLHTHLTTIGAGVSGQVLEASGLNPYISSIRDTDTRNPWGRA